jgi:hypothetical protein
VGARAARLWRCQREALQEAFVSVASRPRYRQTRAPGLAFTVARNAIADQASGAPGAFRPATHRRAPMACEHEWLVSACLSARERGARRGCRAPPFGGAGCWASAEVSARS